MCNAQLEMVLIFQELKSLKDRYVTVGANGVQCLPNVREEEER